MMNNQPSGPPRADRAAFMTMTGVFLLIASLPAVYWAFYSYGEYRRTADFVRGLREKTVAFESETDRRERESRIFINTSTARRSLLEAGLSGAGGLLLFGGAALLFALAFRARGRKPQYENLDRRTLRPPAARVEVRYKRLHDVLFAFIFLFFGLLTPLNFAQTLSSPFSSTREIIVKGVFSAFCFALLFVILYLMIRAKRRAVRLFDASGVTRGDGRHFSWAEFQGVVTLTAVNQRTWNRFVWRKELAFAGGEAAWIIPNRVKNAAEVFDFIATLPPAQPKTRF